MDLDLDFSGELSLLGDIDVIADAPDTDAKSQREDAEKREKRIQTRIKVYRYTGGEA